jgi:hypothetical protein
MFDEAMAGCALVSTAPSQVNRAFGDLKQL